MDDITDSDIRQAVSAGSFDTAQRYFRTRRVLAVAENADGVIEAQVQGTERRPYQQTIVLHRLAGGRTRIDGDCTCFVGHNCKHVAAALLAFRHQAKSPPLMGRNSNLPQPARPAEAAIPGDIMAWLRSLEAAQDVESEEYPPTVRKRLLYVLGRDAFGGPVVNLQTIELRRDDSIAGLPRPQTVRSLTGSQPHKFLRPSDKAILRRLPQYAATGLIEEVVATLRAIIATGRGRWDRWNGPSLAEAEPVPGRIAWSLSDDARQRATLDLPPPLLPLRLSVPWYVNPDTGAVGPVDTDLPARLVNAMLASPWLPPELADKVRGEITRRVPNHTVPPPASFAAPEELRAPLLPRLCLVAGTLPIDPAAVAAGRYAAPAATPYPIPLARLEWCYGPVTLPFQARPAVLVQDGRLLRVVRDNAAEAEAERALRDLQFRPVAQHVPPHLRRSEPNEFMLLDADPGAWIEFMLHDLPQLRDAGWRIDVADDFPVRIAPEAGEILVDLREGSGIDWFDLDLGVMVDGTRISLVPALLDLIAGNGLARRGQPDEAEDMMPVLLPLPDGRLLPVPFARLQPFLGPLLELFDPASINAETGALRLARHNAADLALLEAESANAGIVWTGGEAVRALGRQLREHGGLPPCIVPARFLAALRPYQAHGLAWLQFLRTARLGGVLADDMGLGKTVQALAHLTIEQEAGRLDRPAIVVCPTSLVPNWAAEAARFAPSLRTLVLHGPDRATRFGEIGQHDLVVTTYPLLSRDHAALVAQDWHVVILDEAQTIKNPLATTSKLARTLKARQRLCLSGTPLENHLGELWSLFDFLMPGFLGDRQFFGRRFRGPIEKGGDTDRQASLAQRVAPFLLRRTKAEVASDLPPKTEIAEAVEMGDAQRGIYEGIRLAMHTKVRAAIAKRGLAGSGIIILDALLKLRQSCCDPRLLKLATAKAAKAGSAKLERLMELLPQLLEEGRRVLLFSQFTSMLALIQAELDGLGQPYVLLTGDTKDRTTPVRQFQAGKVPLFLISLKAGGVGLNLTAADTVIHYDPWWNPAVEDQATDRAHRIGQDKPVFVHRLITAGSIEEKMEVLKQRKQALAAGILGSTAKAAQALSESDLDMLFEPLG